MGAQWKHKGRVENANKRGALISKLAKEIIISAKGGDGDPNNNARLRAAVEAAKKASVPRDTIERAIKKGAGLTGEQIQYDNVTYEGFAPHNIPVIVECVTDNKNRTASEIRVLFRKGQLGAIGSVAWMFDKMGIIEATHADKSRDIEDAAINAGAQSVEPLDSSEIPQGHVGGHFTCDPTDLDACNKSLTQDGWIITQSEISFIAKAFPELSDEQRKEVEEFLIAIDDCDDVHRVYTAVK